MFTTLLIGLRAQEGVKTPWGNGALSCQWAFLSPDTERARGTDMLLRTSVISVSLYSGESSSSTLKKSVDDVMDYLAYSWLQHDHMHINLQTRL